MNGFTLKILYMSDERTRRDKIRDAMGTWEYLVIEEGFSVYVETVVEQLDKELDEDE